MKLVISRVQQCFPLLQVHFPGAEVNLEGMPWKPGFVVTLAPSSS